MTTEETPVIMRKFSGKEIVVLVLFLLGILLLAFVTFDLVTSAKYNLVAGALLAWLVGVTVDRFVA